MALALLAALSGCVTTDDLYAEYNCDVCKPNVPVIAAIGTATVGEPAPAPIPSVAWEQAVYFEFDISDLLPREQRHLHQTSRSKRV